MLDVCGRVVFPICFAHQMLPKTHNSRPGQQDIKDGCWLDLGGGRRCLWNPRRIVDEELIPEVFRKLMKQLLWGIRLYCFDSTTGQFSALKIGDSKLCRSFSLLDPFQSQNFAEDKSIKIVQTFISVGTVSVWNGYSLVLIDKGWLSFCQWGWSIKKDNFQL